VRFTSLVGRSPRYAGFFFVLTRLAIQRLPRSYPNGVYASSDQPWLSTFFSSR
jgi:hypothetical protein